MPSPSDRAKTICHMATSLDGKIAGNLVKSKMYLTTLLPDYFEIHHKHFASQTRTIVIGRRLATEMTKIPVEEKKQTAPDASQEGADGFTHEELHTDFLSPIVGSPDKAQRQLVVVVDPHGNFHPPSDTVANTLPWIVGHCWVSALTHHGGVTDAFLAHCRRHHIPYFFCGDTTFGAEVFLRKCKSALGQDAVVLMGGAAVNGSFLREDCIDEMSLQVCPFLCGQKEDLGLFESPVPGEALPYGNYTLKQTEVTAGGSVWMWHTHDKEAFPRVDPEMPSA